MKNVPFIFLSIVSAFCIFLLSATFYWGYKESFIVLNALRIPAFDTLSVWMTEFGNGFYLTVFALILACTHKKHWKTALNIIICVIVTAIIVQICKQVFFPNWHRPAKLLYGKSVFILLNPVPYHNSFPSGHSISVISTATVLSFIVRNRIYEVLLAVLACMVAYTRIYVGAHFPADVAAGSLLGLLTSTVVLYYLRNIHLSHIQEKPYSRYILYGITIVCIVIALFSAI